MKTTNNIKRTMTIAIAAAMITATAMLSGCGCDDSNAINKTATTVQTTSVEEQQFLNSTDSFRNR